jgi:subtilisin family serine protease/subtilisin-like proprotein convertase family protein
MTQLASDWIRAGSRIYFQPRPRIARIGVERLEDRTLLDAGFGTDLERLTIDPTTYDETSILVQYRSELPLSEAPLLAGTQFEARIGLVPGLVIVQLSPDVTVKQALEAYTADPQVEYALPNYRVQLLGQPNDPRFGDLWGLHNTGQRSGTPDADIDAPEAWDNHTGNGSTIVAVIDTGVDYTHPDLAANMWINPGEIPGNGIDDDGNGFVDDIYGYDFVNNDSNPMDDHYHGTHVAGTIGAVGNNGIGVAGVAWRVQIMALKFLDATGSGDLGAAIRAIDYAVANGATISNNSWAGGGFYQPLYNAIANAGASGHLFVAAAGNDNINTDQTPVYPASYNLPNIISVAATTRNDTRSGFSNYGVTTVDLGAPGSDILSTMPNNSYAYLSGTSMAAPHVAGVAALVQDLNPSWKHAEIKQQILATVDAIPAMAGITVTGGRLNAAAAAVGDPPADTSGPYVISHTPASNVGSIASIRVTFSEAIATNTFTLSDIVSFTGPTGNLTVNQVIPVLNSGERQFDITFAPQSAVGSYALTFGPNITDQAVPPNLMDQNRQAPGGEVPGDRYTAVFSISSALRYCSPNVPKSITDFASTSSALFVDEHLPITDLNVELNISHTWVGDLNIYLFNVSTGLIVSLAQNRGGGGENYEDTIFDDEALLHISQGDAPFHGSFRPEGSLATFDGLDAYGGWTLWIEDYYAGDVGTLNSWCLHFEDPTPPQPTLSINDVTVVEGNSGTTLAEFTVTLVNGTGSLVTVQYATANDTATAGSDYTAVSGTLSFSGGTTTRTIQVPILGDLVDEIDERFFVNLSNPVGATLSDDQGIGLILDDDGPSISINDVAVLEGNSGTTNAVFTVRLSAPSPQNVSVAYATADGTATAGSDYTAVSGTLTIPAGSTSITLAVPVLGDLVIEPDETFFVNLSNPVNGTIGDGSGLGTILNDDSLPTGGMYVYDILPQTRTFRGRREVRFQVHIRQDSNHNGIGDPNDASVGGAYLNLEVGRLGDSGALGFPGETNSAGIFRTAWLRLQPNVRYLAEVVELEHNTLNWNRHLDPTSLDTDIDNDNFPDQLYIEPGGSSSGGPARPRGGSNRSEAWFSRPLASVPKLADIAALTTGRRSSRSAEQNMLDQLFANWQR